MTLFNSKKAGMLFGSVVAASLAFATVAAEARDLRGWNIHVEDYPVSHGMEAFLKEVDEKPAAK